jgi:hypothetical protein
MTDWNLAPLRSSHDSREGSPVAKRDMSKCRINKAVIIARQRWFTRSMLAPARHWTFGGSFSLFQTLIHMFLTRLPPKSACLLAFVFIFINRFAMRIVEKISIVMKPTSLAGKHLLFVDFSRVYIFISVTAVVIATLDVIRPVNAHTHQLFCFQWKLFTHFVKQFLWYIYFI